MQGGAQCDGALQAGRNIRLCLSRQADMHHNAWQDMYRKEGAACRALAAALVQKHLRMSAFCWQPSASQEAVPAALGGAGVAL